MPASSCRAYVEQGILPKDPFVSLDMDGVGELMRIAVERGRETKPDLKLGICGEHGGDPPRSRSARRSGSTTSPAARIRVPVARLAAAQAALHGGGDRTV